jgi:hypothetical protein
MRIDILDITPPKLSFNPVTAYVIAVIALPTIRVTSLEEVSDGIVMTIRDRSAATGLWISPLK